MKAKYDVIGTHYNRTRKADAYILERLIKHLSPKENNTYLDVGCGTGNYTVALCKKAFDLIGVEPSAKMLNVAKARSSKVKWLSGIAEDMPLKDENVSGVIATLTTHHWENLEVAFAEIYRVLKANGRFVVFTSNPNLMAGYWLKHYFPTMLEVSAKQMPTYEMNVDALRMANFELIKTEKYFVQDDLEDLFLYSGKHQPNLYLDEKFRKGISSFADLANDSEIESGLIDLENDIRSGKINEIIADFENDKGDYIFIVSEKK